MLLTTVASADDLSLIERSLRQKYEKQVVALQNFYSDSHLKYDTSGTLIGNGHPGSWTTAFVAISSVKLTNSHLEVRGKRVAIEVGVANRLSYVRGDEDVRIEITASPASDEAALRIAIEHVFYPPGATSALFVPDYWRDLLTGNVAPATASDAPPRRVFRSDCPSGVSADASLEVEPSGAQRRFCGGLTIYRASKGGVKPPKALQAADPRYPEFAKQSKYQGTVVLWLVVDQTGHAQMIRIVRALGLGLDDAAVEAVRGWRFKPAELNGQSVAVEITVEVNFRLY